MIIKTGRFGQLTIGEEEIITIPSGVFGFPEYTKYCLVDPSDDTLILWLQSLETPEIAFALLEPKIFRPDYTARLSGTELRELKLDNVNQSAVYSILTIPEDVTQMTANLKAPLVVNLKAKLARQVVLQEVEFNIKHPMFKELRTHLITIQSSQSSVTTARATATPVAVPVAVKDIPPTLTARSLSV